MPPIRVRLPNGQLAEFPEGMSLSEIEDVLLREFPPETPSEVAPVEVRGRRGEAVVTNPDEDRMTELLAASNKPAERFPTQEEMLRLATPPGSDLASKYFPTALEMRELAVGPEQTSMGGAMFRSAERAVAPTLGGLAGAKLGATAGAAVGAPFGGVGAVPGAIVGGLLGGIGGATLASKGQEALLGMMPQRLQELIGQSRAQRERDVSKFPIATMTAEYLPGFLAGRPTAALRPMLASGALGGGFEAGRQVMTGDYDPARLAVATGASAAQARPTRLSNRVLGTPEGVLEQNLRKRVPETPVSVPETRAAIQSLEEVGVKPSLVDVLPQRLTETTVGRLPGAYPTVAALAEKYGEDVLGTGPQSTMSAAERMSERIEPSASGRTPELAKTEATLAVEATAPPIAVESGEGGRTVSERLNKEYDDLWNATRAAYDKARVAPPVTLQQVGTETSIFAPVGDKDVTGYTNTLTGDFIPKEDFGPPNTRDMAVEIASDLKVAGVPLAMDNLRPIISLLRKVKHDNTPEDLVPEDLVPEVSLEDARTSADLFDILQRAEAIRRNTNDGVLRNAAKVFKQALNRQIDRLDAAGRFTDENGAANSEPVTLTREANALRRKLSEQFETNDLVEKATSRDFRSGELKPEVDAEAFSNAVFGSGKGIRQTATTVQDLRALRDRLGEDSPEWKALRQEGAQRILGDDPNKAADKLEQFKKSNRPLYDILVTPADEALTSRSASAVSAKERTEVSLSTGASFLDAEPADFTRAVAAVRSDSAALRDARVAMRQTIRDAIREPRKATSLLERFADNPKAQENMRTLLGDTETEAFVRQAKALTERQRKAGVIAPKAVSQYDDEIKDVSAARVIAGIATAKGTGGFMYALPNAIRFFERMRMPRDRAEQLLRDLTSTDKAVVDRALALIEKRNASSALQRFAQDVQAEAAGRGFPGAGVGARVEIGTDRDTEQRKEISTDPYSSLGTTTVPEEEAGMEITPASFDMSSYKERLMPVEGTGKNPRSSAVGAYQFVDPTFVQVYKQTFPDASGMSDEEILAQRGTGVEEAMIPVFTASNQKTLADAGFAPDYANTYLAHFLGAEGAVNVLSAADDTPIEQVVSPEAISSNPEVLKPGMTAGDLKAWAARKMT